MRTMTKDDIRFSLELGGIRRGDVVLMQSALSSIGHVEGGADAVIDAVLETIGPEGTFAVVTMTFHHPFDAENDPSVVGAISETHRLRPDSIRSLRPVHSVNAIGARAEELTRDHDKCESNCGAGSPYQKLRDMGGKIILLGVDLSRNTTQHAIEDLMNVSYLVDSEVPAPTYLPDYEGETMVMKKFCPGHRDFIGFAADLRRAEALTEVMIGNASVKIIDVRRMFELGQEMLLQDPMHFLCENENCDHCRQARRQAAKEA